MKSEILAKAFGAAYRRNQRAADAMATTLHFEALYKA